MVYGAFLLIPPLGRDYAALARPDTVLFFSSLVSVFGGQAWAYLLTNLLLLYGCMALILLLTRQLTGGPWWLGSVAAVMFMANPVKTEAVLNISGIRDLWPGFMALLTLYVYIRFRRSTSVPARWLPLLAYLGAILTGPTNIMLVAVIVVLEYTLFPKRTRRWLPLALMGAIALFMSGQWAMPGALHPAPMFVPLFLTLYPIGLLPETVSFFQQYAVLGYGLGIVVAILGIWLIRKLNAPAFTFGVLGAIVFRLFQGGFTVDPVTLAGGGRLLVPSALLAIAIAGFFHALLSNNTWRRSVVRVTTLLCVAAMCCQIWVNLHWRHAGREVQRIQDAVAEAAENTSGAAVALVPDLQYYRTTPMMLSESVKYRTPFSEPQPVIPLLPLSVVPPAKIAVKQYSREAVTVSVQGLAAPETTRPPRFSRAWWLRRAQPREPVTLRIKAGRLPFPETHVPY